MDVACSEMPMAHDHQRKGFHTFLMTGDAIIRTNFNPFKPTRQLSLDSNIEPLEKVKTERFLSHEETRGSYSGAGEGRGAAGSDGATGDGSGAKGEDGADDGTATSPHSCTQSKPFIPGFMRVEDGLPSGNQPTMVRTQDSGIDVRLGDETESENSAYLTQSDTEASGSTQKLSVNGDYPLAVGGVESLAVGSSESADPAPIDTPSAKRLATRLYQLDGFHLLDVCHYLSKSDNFTQKVVKEFFRFFDFTGHSIVDSLRAFLVQISLDGRIEDRELVLLHFTRRYLECNKNEDMAATFHSEDSCHTLVCALVLLHNDLHSSSEAGEMRTTRQLFIENLAQMNGGHDFPKNLLTTFYHDIKDCPLVSQSGDDDLMKRLSDALNYGVEPLDEDSSAKSIYEAKNRCYPNQATSEHLSSGNSSILHHSMSQSRLKDSELMCGYIMKKNCKGLNGVRTPSGKRGWRRHFAILRELKLMLSKSDKPVHRQSSKSIDLDNAYASAAIHYTKRKHAFTILTADGSEYLVVAGSRDAMEDWIYSINLTTSVYSKEPTVDSETQCHTISYLAPLGSPRRMREQLHHYESLVKEIGNHLLISQNDIPEKGVSKQRVQELSERKRLQQHQLQKYTTYMKVLKMHLNRFKPRSNSVTESIAEEPGETIHSVDEQMYWPGCRISYRIAVYGQWNLSTG